MKNKQRGSTGIIIAIIVAVILIGAGFYFANRNSSEVGTNEYNNTPGTTSNTNTGGNTGGTYNSNTGGNTGSTGNTNTGGTIKGGTGSTTVAATTTIDVSGTWKTYTDRNNLFTVDYPGVWAAPKTVTLGDQYVVDFGNTVKVSTGTYYGQSIDKNMTLAQLVENVKVKSTITVSNRSGFRVGNTVYLPLKVNDPTQIMSITRGNLDEATFIKLLATVKIKQ